MATHAVRGVRGVVSTREQYFATCPRGLEAVLAEELTTLGAGEVRGTVEAVTALLRNRPTLFAYQSQGRSGETWLGPTVESVVDELASSGCRQVLVAPIGFLCDHVETLFDIDIELKQLAVSRGMQLERIAMLNDSPAMIEILVDVLAVHESSLTIPS